VLGTAGSTKVGDNVALDLQINVAECRQFRADAFALGRRHLLHLPQPQAAFQALQIPKRFKNTLPVVTKRFTDEAHETGLRVDVWTIDEPDEMREMLDAGVDGIMTDRPDRLTDVLATHT